MKRSMCRGFSVVLSCVVLVGCPAGRLVVPDVAGLTRAEANSVLRDAGLEVRIASEEYSDTVAEGCIVRQTPEANAVVAPDSVVDLVLSLGPDPDAGWFSNPATGNCYKLTSAQSWRVAHTVAEDWGGRLVSIDDEEENQWLRDTFGAFCTWAWIGMTDQENEGAWHWSGGSGSSYRNWADGEPNNVGGAEHYGAIHLPLGTWWDLGVQDSRGTYEYPGIVEKPCDTRVQLGPGQASALRDASEDLRAALGSEEYEQLLAAIVADLDARGDVEWALASGFASIDVKFTSGLRASIGGGFLPESGEHKLQPTAEAAAARSLNVDSMQKAALRVAKAGGNPYAVLMFALQDLSNPSLHVDHATMERNLEDAGVQTEVYLGEEVNLQNVTKELCKSPALFLIYAHGAHSKIQLRQFWPEEGIHSNETDQFTVSMSISEDFMPGVDNPEDHNWLAITGAFFEQFDLSKTILHLHGCETMDSRAMYFYEHGSGHNRDHYENAFCLRLGDDCAALLGWEVTMPSSWMSDFVEDYLLRLSNGDSCSEALVNMPERYSDIYEWPYELLDNTVATLSCSSDNFVVLPTGSDASLIGPIEVNSPPTSASWEAGTSHAITWEVKRDVGEHVYIDLYRNGELRSAICNQSRQWPASSGSYEWWIPAGQEPCDDYTVRVYSTQDNSIYGESGVFEIVGQSRPLPDLVPGSLTVMPDEPSEDDVITLAAYVYNDGQGDANSFWCRLDLDGKVEDWRKPGPLGANEHTGELSFEIGPLAAGTHDIALVVDPGGEVEEENESNNTSTRGLSVSQVPTDCFFAHSVTPTGAGVITPASGSYPCGTVLDVQASPSYGYVFERWQGDGPQGPDEAVLPEWVFDNPLNDYVLHADKTLTAVFAARESGEETIFLPGDVPLVMVWVPAGAFLMGAPPDEEESYPREYPQHEVVFDQGFWIGKYEITKQQWLALQSKVPWAEHEDCLDDPDSPAEYISWTGAQNFIIALDGWTGLTFRLPSEAEWEYACRAGTTTPFYWGYDLERLSINLYAWWQGNTVQAGECYAHVVGSKLPNDWGLYDMAGNVWEWCEDRFHGDYDGAPRDGTPWLGDVTENNYRVVRGGGWDFLSSACRSAYRSRHYCYGNLYGFRVVR